MPIQGFNRTAATAQTEQVKKDVEKFSGKTHPAAKLAWVAIGCFIVMAVLFTGYHNWQLYKRGMGGTGVGDALAIVPPILLDGGIIVLLVLLIWYFKDPTQWLVGVVFNILLFVIVIVNTSLNYSLNSGEAMSAELKIYLHWGVLGSFVLVLAMYEILIHVDPNHKRQQEKAKLAAQAQDDLHELEVKTIQHGIEEQKGEVQYSLALAEKMHTARMKAIESQSVDEALVDFEVREAIERAKQIRGAHSTAPKS